MFNIGPLELIVLAFVGIVVLGPDRLPGVAKDAARLIRSLREIATGARTTLRDELGPEFANLDLRSLHPRTLITRTLLGSDPDSAAADIGRALRFDWLGEDSARESTRSDPATGTMEIPLRERPLPVDGADAAHDG